MFPAVWHPAGPHSSILEECLHTIILRPKKPLGSWNLVNPLLRMNEAWMNVLPDYNPWQININPYNTKLSQQKFFLKSTVVISLLQANLFNSHIFVLLVHRRSHLQSIVVHLISSQSYLCHHSSLMKDVLYQYSKNPGKTDIRVHYNLNKTVIFDY